MVAFSFGNEFTHGAAPAAAIVIVDAALSGYAPLLRQLPSHLTEIHFVTSGESALELAALVPAATWIINRVLPDMRGLALCNRLSRMPGQTDLPRRTLLVNDAAELTNRFSRS